MTTWEKTHKKGSELWLDGVFYTARIAMSGEWGMTVFDDDDQRIIPTN